MDDRFFRNRLLIGEEAQDTLSAAHVAVFGMGGVGSYAAEGLARVGVGRLTLVDFDLVGLTNINRQIMALGSTLGQPKVDAMASRIADINPECKVETHRCFFDQEMVGKLLAPGFSAIIDAIDSFHPKITLLVEALRLKVPLFSGMGAASKLDPAQIRIGDISQSTICPFARRIRKRLRAFGISTGFKVVYSVEPPILPYHPSEIAEEHREITLKRGRERMVQGSICYIPAIFGMALAGLAVQQITGITNAQQTRAEESVA